MSKRSSKVTESYPKRLYIPPCVKVLGPAGLPIVTAMRREHDKRMAAMRGK